jgi:hypothetical protein
MAQCNVQSLLSNAGCFNCLSPGEWDVLELQLLCEILNVGGGSGIALQTQTQSLDNISKVYTFAHSIVTNPRIVIPVLLCKSNDAGSQYQVGDEVALPGSLLANASGGAPTQVRTTVNFIFVAFTQALVGNEATWFIMPSLGGGVVNPTSFNNFSLKIYYA